MIGITNFSMSECILSSVLIHPAPSLQSISTQLCESQYEGYVENGIYTEYNEDEAREVLAMVLEGLDILLASNSSSLPSCFLTINCCTSKELMFILKQP